MNNHGDLDGTENRVLIAAHPRGVAVVYDVNHGTDRRTRQIDYGQGRRCGEPGCITTLNRYNAGPGCSLHPDAPGEPAGRHACPGCGIMRDAICFVRPNGQVNGKCNSCLTRHRRRAG